MEATVQTGNILTVRLFMECVRVCVWVVVVGLEL